MKKFKDLNPGDHIYEYRLNSENQLTVNKYTVTKIREHSDNFEISMLKQSSSMSIKFTMMKMYTYYDTHGRYFSNKNAITKVLEHDLEVSKRSMRHFSKVSSKVYYMTKIRHINNLLKELQNTL